MNNKRKISIIGGAGHVGFPLGLIFSSKGYKVSLVDKNEENIRKINKGAPPFLEDGSKFLLKKMLKYKRIKATNKIHDVKNSKYIIICIGTPIDKNLDPKLKNFLNFFKSLKNHINKSQIIIIRSSIYPGTCLKVQKLLGKKFKNISYCPERVVQGKSISELPKLPQIVSGLSENSINRSKVLFKLICNKIIITTILEAELTKLFSNAWRYINFSISNQFYNICENLDINFRSLRKNMIEGYERNKSMPMAGFAAGPCLYKDTAQLNAFLKNSFTLGIAATKINQSFPKAIYSKMFHKFKSNLFKKKIGILGLAFKSDIDDTRDSLSLNLYRLLKKKKLNVKISDDFVDMKGLINKKELIKKCDIIILGVPHSTYKNIKIPKNKYLIDSWGFFEK